MFIGCQCLINLIRVFWGQVNVNNGMGILLFSYFLMIYVIISLQSLLEMFLNSCIAFLIVNIYIVFSCISISEKGLPKYIYYLSLSNYGMGFKQNLGKANSLYYKYFKYSLQYIYFTRFRSCHSNCISA
ncbi:DUF2705 family protein [Heyndrickxia coagulans]|uniref:DUF2705 family protein n=1 Tax=Heyndrickxia coagulans TaxID=1398 RepID=UPI0034623F4A